MTLWEWLEENHDPEYLKRRNEQRNALAYEMGVDDDND